MNSKKPSRKIAIIASVTFAILLGISTVFVATKNTKNDNNGNGNNGNGTNGNGSDSVGQGGQEGADVDVDDPFDIPKVVGCVKTQMDESLLDWDLPSYDIDIEEDIVYGKGALNGGKEIDLRLDIYRPITNGESKHPLMIHIHGGSFTGGDKGGLSTGTESSSGWAERGYIVASINYRLAGDDPLPSDKAIALTEYIREETSNKDPVMAIVASLEDTLAAYEYMKSLDSINLDSEVVVLNGYSAGAISSLWTTYGIDNFGYDRPPIKAVISHWGTLVAKEEEVKRLIPGMDVPTFLVHATGDSVVSYTGTQLLANRFESLAIPYALHCRDSGDHSISIDKVEHQQGLTILQAEQYWLRHILAGA